MQGLLEKFSISRAKQDIPQLKPGLTVKVYQKIKEGSKERIQIFEGLIIAMHRKQGTSATITVRKESYGVGSERIFPLSAPFIEKIEIVKEAKVRRAKLFYMRERTGKKARMKIKEKDTKNKMQKTDARPEELLENTKNTEEIKGAENQTIENQEIKIAEEIQDISNEDKTENK